MSNLDWHFPSSGAGIGCHYSFPSNAKTATGVESSSRTPCLRVLGLTRSVATGLAPNTSEEWEPLLRLSALSCGFEEAADVAQQQMTSMGRPLRIVKVEGLHRRQHLLGRKGIAPVDPVLAGQVHVGHGCLCVKPASPIPCHCIPRNTIKMKYFRGTSRIIYVNPCSCDNGTWSITSSINNLISKK